MAIIQEHITINGKNCVRTYSDAGRYVVGGFPHAAYIDAIDLEESGRIYTEGDLIDDELSVEDTVSILLGGETE